MSPVVHQSIVINAPLSKAWKAITDPELIKQWTADEELTVRSGQKAGTLISFKGNLHGTDFENKGTILRFEPEKLFEYNYWSSLWRIPQHPDHLTNVTFALAFKNNRTILELTQRHFPGATSFEHSEFYWRATLVILKKFIECL